MERPWSGHGAFVEHLWVTTACLLQKVPLVLLCSPAPPCVNVWLRICTVSEEDPIKGISVESRYRAQCTTYSRREADDTQCLAAARVQSPHHSCIPSNVSGRVSATSSAANIFTTVSSSTARVSGYNNNKARARASSAMETRNMDVEEAGLTGEKSLSVATTGPRR
ncbi:uncharacterized protein SPSK_02799 [Sporothrix schenckii 1099-18]|uniref:Uncharacterized protein n=1 Tax=Sporothrix schenckii 1099-18 TaxID=1397361 RepID=A0A0F2MBD2_SPOSC|nr:uncharacterized protein SPSK_02799 [Sporothrix schenckii 1099-18]KJR86409.1 hypothetical protein SPSK_02799 [Sporothrix schenckii 1099-18]